MYFKRIDMHGFKSFAEPVSIEFGQGITCIVGPNGSGKSNISDAIRWVLGEQSPKALRGGKMDEVIFAGTANRKSRGMAEVTLVIDNSTNILPIEYDEVAITRRMYRSGESEYLINNNQCRLRDIRELIMDTGIGVDGYSLIGQGKISEIVSGKPESRRELFEEAAGIVMYRARKAETEKKLETANLNLDRVNDIVSELQERLGPLEDQSKKAKEYVTLKERLKSLDINITLKNIEDLDLKFEYLNDDIIELTAEVQKLQEEKTLIDEEVINIKANLEKTERLIIENNEKLINLIGEISNLESKFKIDEEKTSVIEANKERLNRELLYLEDKQKNEKKNAEVLLNEIGEKEAQLSEINQILSKKVEEFSIFSSQLTQELAKIDSQKKEVYELYSNAALKKAQNQNIDKLVENFNERKNEITREEEKNKELLEQACDEKEEVERQKQKVIAQISEIKREVQELKSRHQEKSNQENQDRKEIENIRLEIGGLQSRKKTMEEMVSNYDGYNSAVKYVMKSDLTGIRGVVAELIKVPQGYETAIETALGAGLQNIVCESDSNAKKAINILKENKAGRLTFLPMTSIKGGMQIDATIERETGFIGYGIDCIEFEKEYRNIFEYLLGRIIVAKDMDSAIRISNSTKKSFKVVTLEGEVINASGAITGGKYRTVTANLLGRKAEIEQIEKKIIEKRALEDKKKNAIEAVRFEIESINSRAETIRSQYRALEIDLINFENEFKNVERLISELTYKKEKNKAEIQFIQDEISKSSYSREEYCSQILALESKAKILEEEVEENLIHIENRRNSIAKINEEITELRMSRASYEEQKNASQNMLDRIEGEIAGMKANILKNQEELKQLMEDVQDIEKTNRDVEEAIAAKIKEKATITIYSQELSEEKADLLNRQNIQQARKTEIDSKFNILHNSKYEMEIKRTKIETNLENYKEKLWEEYETTYIQAMSFKKCEFDMGEAVKEAKDLKGKIKSLGTVNLAAIDEFEEVAERHTFLTEQRQDIVEATNSLKAIIEDMDRTIKLRFRETFDKIIVNFQEIFEILFGGGHAELRFDNANNPLEAGIEIVAQPPGKKLQNINLMSGGEKTMTAIALMFAILKVKPTPFCILDEVEAALDEANIFRFIEYLRRFQDIQFTLVTHQKATMEKADVLYGVTMPEQGISKIISLKLGEEFEV